MNASFECVRMDLMQLNAPSISQHLYRTQRGRDFATNLPALRPTVDSRIVGSKRTNDCSEHLSLKCTSPSPCSRSNPPTPEAYRPAQHHGLLPFYCVVQIRSMRFPLSNQFTTPIFNGRDAPVGRGPSRTCGGFGGWPRLRNPFRHVRVCGRVDLLRLLWRERAFLRPGRLNCRTPDLPLNFHPVAISLLMEAGL